MRLSDTNGFVNTIRPMGRNSRSCRTLTDDGTTHWADDSVLGLGGRPWWWMIGSAGLPLALDTRLPSDLPGA